MTNKKPRLGQTVYVLYFHNYETEPFMLWKDKIFMNNKESFILKDVLLDVIIEECRTYFDYEREGVEWFRTLADAKKAIAKMYPNLKLKKETNEIGEVWYNLVEGDINEK